MKRAEQSRVEGIIAQIKTNQQELLDDLRDKRRQGESDMAVAKVKYNNVLVMETRIRKAYLAEARTNKERAIAQAQLTRSGHVYVISNVGSFGEHVYKIGMTRRLDPMDRVKELGDASVPFAFDVHAIIYSEDAPALENKLHKLFHTRRVNLINERKEFFRVTIEEIAQAVRENHGEIEITLAAEAIEYRKTLAKLQTGDARPSVMNLMQIATHGI